MTKIASCDVAQSEAVLVDLAWEAVEDREAGGGRLWPAPGGSGRVGQCTSETTAASR